MLPKWKNVGGREQSEDGKIGHKASQFNEQGGVKTEDE